MQIDFTKNHFALFNLPVAFPIDLPALDEAYREVQREVHPDRFSQSPAAEQRVAAQWAMQVNEAYKTLRSPLNRGRYFLRVHGIDTEEESNTAMPVDFLMQQMDWREAVVAARDHHDEPRLNALADAKRVEETRLFSLLTLQLAETSQFHAARETVRKLRFLEKLGEEIDLASETVTG